MEAEPVELAQQAFQLGVDGERLGEAAGVKARLMVHGQALPQKPDRRHAFPVGFGWNPASKGMSVARASGVSGPITSASAANDWR